VHSFDYTGKTLKIRVPFHFRKKTQYVACFVAKCMQSSILEFSVGTKIWGNW